ncbi:MAG: Crp/Fnr family transcriptional regulator [Bacilli bacterium]
MANCNCIDQIPIFDILNHEQKHYVSSLVEQRSYKAGQTIYIPGDEANSLYIVSSGRIRIYRLSESGKEQLLRIVIPGEFTGELALFKEGIYEAFAEALDDVNICMIHHNSFKNLLLKFPRVSIKMLQVLANRLSSSEEQTAWISTESVRDRLIHYLVRSSYLNPNKEMIVKLSLPKKDLASYLGTTPESLSREWTNLLDSGKIKNIEKNKIKLINLNINY